MELEYPKYWCDKFDSLDAKVYDSADGKERG